MRSFELFVEMLQSVKAILICLVAVFVLGMGTWGYFKITAPNKERAAKQQVNYWTSKLDGLLTAEGRYDRKPDSFITERDPWGAHFAVRYGKGTYRETVAVISAGPDRRMDTSDDVVVEKSVVLTGVVGKAVEEGAWKAQEAVSGAATAVKEGAETLAEKAKALKRGGEILNRLRKDGKDAEEGNQ